MSKVQLALSVLRKHIVPVIGIVLIVLNALIANGDISLSAHTVDLLNAVLAAAGLGILHKRTV
jgi:hypothetical protein